MPARAARRGLHAALPPARRSPRWRCSASGEQNKQQGAGEGRSVSSFQRRTGASGFGAARARA
jgi:hypothetical protein